jgi:hypothetical protein
MVGLNWWRLGSHVLSCICGCVLLGADSISCIVGDVACGVSGNSGWGVVYGISYNVETGVDLLHHFVFTSSLFSHEL